MRASEVVLGYPVLCCCWGFGEKFGTRRNDTLRKSTQKVAVRTLYSIPGTFNINLNVIELAVTRYKNLSAEIFLRWSSEDAENAYQMPHAREQKIGLPSLFILQSFSMGSHLFLYCNLSPSLQRSTNFCSFKSKHRLRSI